MKNSFAFRQIFLSISAVEKVLGISPIVANMDEIATKCAGLRLTEKEESEVDLIPPVTETECVLIGKFCTK